MKSVGVVLIRDQIGKYLNSLRSEYSAQLILPPKDGKTETANGTTSTNVVKKEMNKMTMNPQKKVDQKNVSSHLKTTW